VAVKEILKINLKVIEDDVHLSHGFLINLPGINNKIAAKTGGITGLGEGC
jgi:hypothetical protein